jgi:hypothetical protein
MKENLSSTVLSQAEAKGSTCNTIVSLGLCLRQKLQFLISAFLLKTIFEKLIKTKEIAINVKS